MVGWGIGVLFHYMFEYRSSRLLSEEEEFRRLNDVDSYIVHRREDGAEKWLLLYQYQTFSSYRCWHFLRVCFFEAIEVGI
jgi:hypothetical protein